MLGLALAPALESVSGGLAIVGGAVMAVLLGTLMEGVVVGVAQERVLRQRLNGLRHGAWIRATALGAGLAWLVGVIPSTVVAFTHPDPGDAPSEPGAIVQYSLAVVLGLATGPLLGIAQWVVLRRFVERAGRWLRANAVAWGTGMSVIFLGMYQVPWMGRAEARVLAIYGVCGAAGVVVGAIHGWILLQLLRGPLAKRASGERSNGRRAAMPG